MEIVGSYQGQKNLEGQYSVGDRVEGRLAGGYTPHPSVLLVLGLLRATSAGLGRLPGLIFSRQQLDSHTHSAVWAEGWQIILRPAKVRANTSTLLEASVNAGLYASVDCF